MFSAIRHGSFSRPIAARGGFRSKSPIIEPPQGLTVPQWGLVGFQSYADVGGTTYGAVPNDQTEGWIGGHAGYFDIKTSGDATATTRSELQTAINNAISGDVIYVPHTASIDLSTFALSVDTPGITIASNRGADIGGVFSDGALLYTDAVESRDIIKINADNVRFTGYRIKGPDEHHELYLPVSDPFTKGITINGANCEVDNCELLDFTHWAVRLDNRNTNGHRVHHCYIHHCSMKERGYGVSMDQAGTTIDYCLFDAVRHATGSSGRQSETNGGTGNGTYTVEHCVTLDTILGVMFDMHASAESGGTLGAGDGGLAGVMICRNNRALGTQHATTGSDTAVAQIRGTPYAAGSMYRHNWINWDTESYPIGGAGGIFKFKEEIYDCSSRSPTTCPSYDANLWDGDNKVVQTGS